MSYKLFFGRHELQARASGGLQFDGRDRRIKKGCLGVSPEQPFVCN